MTDKVVWSGVVGEPTAAPDGTEVRAPRYGRASELIVGLAGGEYEEAASRGEIYTSCLQAECTYGTALTATAVTLTLYNPVGSLVDLVLLHVGLTIRTGSTAGHIVLAANINNAAAVPATNTAVTVYNAKLDASAGYGICYSVTTLPAAPVAIRSLAYVVSTAPVNAGSVSDHIKGGVVIGPNTAVTVQGITIVGTGLVSFLWRERKRLAA